MVASEPCPAKFNSNGAVLRASIGCGVAEPLCRCHLSAADPVECHGCRPVGFLLSDARTIVFVVHVYGEIEPGGYRRRCRCSVFMRCAEC